MPGVLKIYSEAAQALGCAGRLGQLVLVRENLPEGRFERQGFIGAAFLVHNLALEAWLRAAAEQCAVPLSFMAYTGESFGIIAAAVASGALSCGDGIKISRAFVPLLVQAAEGVRGDEPFARTVAAYLPEYLQGIALVPEPFHVVALKGDPADLAKALKGIGMFYPQMDVEVHKLYSWRQTNIYVRSGIKPAFNLFMKNFPAVQTEELKSPTTFLAHSSRLRCVRRALERFIDENGIVFKEPHTPVISNHGAGLLTSAVEVRSAVLAMTDEIMTSRTTVETLASLNPDLVLELGLGGKSVKLLTDNNTEIPVMACTGAPEETGLLLRAVTLLENLLAEIANLHNPDSRMTARHYNVLRDLFRLAATSPFCERYLYRSMSRVITKEMLRIERQRSLAFYRFLEIFQHTWLHRESIDVHQGELILQAHLKKKIIGGQERLGQVYAELKVIDGTGGVTDQSVRNIEHPELVVFHFGPLADLKLAELSRHTLLLLDTQPLARDIYAQVAHKLRIEDAVAAALPGGGTLTVEQLAISHIVYQYALFHVLRHYRPAIFAQRDYFLQGIDLMGWLIALAASGATSLAEIVELYCAWLRDGAGGNGMQAALEQLIASLVKPAVPVISREGMPVYDRKTLEAATRGVLRREGGEAEVHHLHLNGNCQVISLGSALLPGRVSAAPHKSNVISVLSPVDLGRRENSALDTFEALCISTLTADNEKVLRYARSRRLLSSTVYTYVNVGERIVGFGKGGSESMTIFLTREAMG